LKVVPVIAEIRNYSPNMITINPEEVDVAFTISLERLTDPNFIRHTQYKTHSGKSYVLPVYEGGVKKFWGMTAMVTHFLLCSLLNDEQYKSKLPFVTLYDTNLEK
jgi:hypothetical protein